MIKYKFTNKAVEDLSDIWNYTFETWSENQADLYYAEILDKCDELVEGKIKGKFYFSLLDNLKGIKVRKHIIFYRRLSEELYEIERILHERMDLRRRLKGK